MKLSVLSWILCVLGLIGLLAWSGMRYGGVSAPATAESGNALIGGHFTLVDGSGKPVTDSDFRGRYMLVYFGFTHCPDICPTTLLTMQNALDGLDGKAKKITPVFITLDPERDDANAVGAYVSHFGERMVGLTGSAEQIRAAADAYKVYYRKVEQPDSAMGYVIDHSGFIYLMGPDGRYLKHFPHGIAEQSLTEALNAAIR
jgi:cytochrome oxidase Cu insertion factor (SCO1/SenC/PrrC family)